jgi:hypothetical protein
VPCGWEKETFTSVRPGMFFSALRMSAGLAAYEIDVDGTPL